MSNALEGGRNITNLRSADDIDALAEDEQELEAQVEDFDKTCTRYKMEISAENTKLMTNGQWHPERIKSKRAEVRHCNKLQVPWSSCFR